MHINLKNKKQTQGGFSLIEMLTVIAIFAIISSIVLFNHGKFTSQTILTNVAYEVALSIREAQIYGVSVRNTGDDTTPFDAPYGIHIQEIPNGGLSQYILFKDISGDKRFTGNCTTNSEECVTTYTVQRNITITNIKTKVGTSACVGRKNNGLNISFERPDPTAIFKLQDNNNVLSTVTLVEIELTSTDGDKRYIIVANNGQISVQNDPIC